MLVTGGALAAVPAALSVWGTKAAVVGTAVALLSTCGCRLTVRVTSAATRVVRKVMFFVPWSWRTYALPPNAYAAGWGDFADPAALYLDVGGTRPIELGWGGKETPSCDDLADRINAAIERASTPDA
jgi:hypothetical protein